MCACVPSLFYLIFLAFNLFFSVSFGILNIAFDQWLRFEPDLASLRGNFQSTGVLHTTIEDQILLSAIQIVYLEWLIFRYRERERERDDHADKNQYGTGYKFKEFQSVNVHIRRLRWMFRAQKHCVYRWGQFSKLKYKSTISLFYWLIDWLIDYLFQVPLWFFLLILRGHQLKNICYMYLQVFEVVIKRGSRGGICGVAKKKTM